MRASSQRSSLQAAGKTCQGRRSSAGGDLGMVVDLRCFIGSRMSMADSRDCQAAMSGLVARDLSLTRCGMASANRTPNGIGYVLGSRVI